MATNDMENGKTLGEWVTLPQAAVRLGVSYRTAARYAAERLSSEHKRKIGKRSVEVVFEAIAAAVPLGSDRNTGDRAAASDRTVDDTGKNMAGFVAHLQEENQYLRRQLERALDIVSSQEQRVRQLEQLEAKLIQALPTPQDLGAQEATSGPPQAAVEDNDKVAKLGWWGRVFGRHDGVKTK